MYILINLYSIIELKGNIKKFRIMVILNILESLIYYEMEKKINNIRITNYISTLSIIYNYLYLLFKLLLFNSLLNLFSF